MDPRDRKQFVDITHDGLGRIRRLVRTSTGKVEYEPVMEGRKFVDIAHDELGRIREVFFDYGRGSIVYD